MPTDPLGHLYFGLVHLFAWLQGHSRYFGDNAATLPGLDKWRERLTQNGTNDTLRHHHYMMAQVLMGNVVVGVLFAQCSGRNVSVYWLGVDDHQRYRGIGSLLLGWYLSGLPSTAAEGTVTLGTKSTNQPMLRWCARFSPTQSPLPESNDVVIVFPIKEACAKLEVPLPSQPDYSFGQEFSGQYTIKIVYGGRHPNFVDAEHPVTMNDPAADWKA